MATQWNDPAWRQRMSDPLAFTASYLPLQEQAPGSAPVSPRGAPAASPSGAESGWALGARAERWTLYHQVTLLERAFRRTLTVFAATPSSAADMLGGCAAEAGGAGSSSSAAAAAAASPICSHLHWCLPVIAQLLSCLHGLWDPCVKVRRRGWVAGGTGSPSCNWRCVG